MIIAVMMVSFVALLFEYRSLKRQNRNREIVISASLLTVGLLLGILVIINAKVQSPLVLIIALFKPISQYVAKLLA